jgi:hypothetical protein
MFMRKYLFLGVMLSGYYLSGLAQPSPQTKTANLFNNISEAYLNLWSQEGPQYVSADDDSYAYSKKLSPKRGTLLLVLRDFRFDIPSDATIENIAVSARRFKKGKGSIKDYFATLIREPVSTGFGTPYGVRWTDPNNYPDIETEVIYSQSGAGNNGGVLADQAYQWTPAMINDPAFGVRIDNYPPEHGSVVVYYDLVEITVVYSVPAAASRKSTGATETKPLKEPIVYPNPFTTKTSIQFTAAESGNAVVELYNISGAKIRTLFSGNVIQGQVYNVIAGDAQLPKGIYVYLISNGKQKHTGRIIKLE